MRALQNDNEIHSCETNMHFVRLVSESQEFWLATSHQLKDDLANEKIAELGSVMGSTGSGSFSDYPGSRPQGGSQEGGGGGSSGEDRCAQAFSCGLQEVEQCNFFAANGSVPPVDTQLFIEHSDRLFAVDQSGQTVGALPTAFNFIADCLAAGFRYEGRVNSSASTPVASVNVDFIPLAP